MYVYKEQRLSLFTDEGQITFLEVRDQVHALIKASGACTVEKAIACISGNSWLLLACVDRLIELEEIRQVDSRDQDRVFVKGKRPV